MDHVPDSIVAGIVAGAAVGNQQVPVAALGACMMDAYIRKRIEELLRLELTGELNA